MAAFCCRRHILSLRRYSSSILSPDSKSPLSADAKTRAALSLLKSEQNPEKVLDICRAATLSPNHHNDRLALSLAVSNLSKSNNFSYIKSYIDELRSTRKDLENERFIAHAIVLFGQAKMVNDAVSLFKEYHESASAGSVKCLNALIFACILAKDFKEMKRVYFDFPRIYNVRPDVETYNRIIKGFGESMEANSSYSILSEMEHRSLKPNAATFSEMLIGFYNEKKLDDVDKVILLMKNKYNLRQTVPIINVRIKCLCKQKKTSDAKNLLDEMLQRGQKPDSATFSEIIRGFCWEGNLEEAKRYFDEMLKRRLRTSGDLYFTLVHFHLIGGDVEGSLRFCKEAIERNWVPNFTTVKGLVNSLKGKGKVDEAKELIGLVKSKGLRKMDMWEEIEAGFNDSN